MTEHGADEALVTGLDEITMLVERGALSAAQARAQELLLRYPNNAAVHAALGDIAAARHQHREAIEWYELSLRLAQTPGVQERLARERDRLEAERLAEFEETLPAPRNNRLLLAGIGGGVVLLAVFVGLLVHLSQRPRGEEPTPPPAPGRPLERVGGTPQPLPTTPAPARPAERAGSRPAAAPVTPTPGGRPGQSTTLKVTQSVDAPMADQDVLLTRALASLTWPSGEMLGWRAQALVDPCTGYALLTAELPPGMRGGELYTPVMDMAYRLAVTAINSDRGVDTLTVRILAPVVNEKGREATLVAFRGNTTRDALDYYLKRGIQPDRETLWKHVFATTWWNPSVPAGQAAAQ